MLRKDQMEKRLVPYGENAVRGSIGSTKSMKSLSKGKSVGRYSTALMPVVENAANLRAMSEIEAIKQTKKDKEADELMKQAQSNKRQSKKDKELRE